MMAAESREGKRSLSTCDDEDIAAKRNKKQVPKITGNKDVFCWTCHRPGNVAACSECPRAYHLKCGHLDRIPEPSEKWVCPECDTIHRADKQAPSSPAHKSTFSKLLGFVLDRVKRVDGVDNFSTPVDTNKWHDYLDYVIQPMDLPRLKSNIDAHKYRCVESFLADFRWLVHASYVYNSVHSVYTKIAKSMINIAKQECEEVKNCSECYMHACTLGDTWFIEPCTTPHILVWAQLSGFPYWPAKVMRHHSGDVVDVRFFGDHTRANVPAASCFLYSRVMPCSVKGKKHSSKITNGIEEAEVYVKNLKSTYNMFCYAQYRVNYLPKEEECMRKLQLPEFTIANETPEFLSKVESMRKEKMLEDKAFHSEMKRMITEQEKSKRPSVPQKRKSVDSGSKLLEMKRKLVKIDTPQGQKLAIMNVSGSESDSSPKRATHLKSPVSSLSDAKLPVPDVRPETNGDHNSNKTLSKVDDETIKQVLARSPKESTAMADKISPLTPPKDSGIIESLSRKLLTPPKTALFNGSEKSGLLTRSLSQRLSTPNRDASLESDSDSDALVIAEESPPTEIPRKSTSAVGSDSKSQLSLIRSPPETVKLYLKTRSAEVKKQHILIRKSYIDSDNSSSTNLMMSALPAGENDSLPISERKTVIVHGALPPTVSELKEPVTSPPVSRRTRRSLNIDLMKKAIGSSNELPSSVDSSSAEQEEPKTVPLNKKPRRASKDTREPQNEGSSPAVKSSSTDEISSLVEDVKSRDTLANNVLSRPSIGVCESQTDDPPKPDSEPAESTTNSLSSSDIASPTEELKPQSRFYESLTGSEPSKTDGEHAESAVNSQSTDDTVSPTKDEGSKFDLASKKPSIPSCETKAEEPSKTDSEPNQSATMSPSTVANSLPSQDEKSRIMLAGMKRRKSREESDELSTDATPKNDCEPQSATGMPSAGNMSSSSIEFNNTQSRRQLMETCDLDSDGPRKTDSRFLINSNCDEVATEGSQSSESKDIEMGSTTDAKTAAREPALDLPPTEPLPLKPDVPSAEINKELMDEIIPHDDGKGGDSDSLTPASLPENVNSGADIAHNFEGEVQQTTPVKSVICHYTGHSPAHVSSPESSSEATSPEWSVLLNAVRKVPASMEVPVIKVVRAQHTTLRKGKEQSCEKSSTSKVANIDVVADSSSDIIPVEETDDQIGPSNVTCTASEAEVVLPTSGRAGILSTIPISVEKENLKPPSTEAEDRSVDPAEEKSGKSIGDGLSETKIDDSQERPKAISSLDMLDGDLSHLYLDLGPPEEDDESDEPMSSKVTPEDEVVPFKEVDVPGSADLKRDEPLEEGTKSNSDASEGTQQLQNCGCVEPAAMDLDNPANTSEKTDPVQKKVADSKSPSQDSSSERASTAKSVAESPVETEITEEGQPIPRPPLEGCDSGTVVADKRASESPNVVVGQPDSGSCDTETVSSTSDMSTDPPVCKPPTPDLAAIEIRDTPEKKVDLLPLHTPEKKNGQCTCIMCHVAHPGASFDKTVEDYHIMKSIELVEPKRGLSRETEEFLNRLKQTDAFTVAQEACEKALGVVEASRQLQSGGRDVDSSRNPSRRRKSFNSLERRAVLVSSLAPRKSTNSPESGPSTSSGKPSRPLPGLVTLTKDVVQRRLSSELKASQSERNSLGELQISSSMSLNPSVLEHQSNADAGKTPAGKDSTSVSSSESQGGNDPKKAPQNATTMPLPIIIKPDPDAGEVPEVPNNQVPPSPPKPTIKLKQMSMLLERPPPPPSPKKPEPSNSNRKECTTPKFNMVPPFEPKKTLADVRKLIESKSQFISAKLKKDIYTLFDQIQHEYDSHMELLEHIADASLNTVESTLETNKNLVFEEMKIRLRNQVDAHVADVKKKQWCVLCGNEAAFHCCWGYNYCCEDCQKNDWAEHTKVCTQYNMTATDPYIRASPRFQALLEKQVLTGANKKIMVQDLIDSPVAVSVQSSSPGKAKPTLPKGRKILAGPRTSFLENDMSLDSTNLTSLTIPSLSKTSPVATAAAQRITDQVTSYKIVQPGRTVRIINPPKPRLPQVVPKPQLAAKAVARPVVCRTPATNSSGIQRKQIMTSGRVVPGQQNNQTSFLRVMDEREIASILQRNHLSEY